MYTLKLMILLTQLGVIYGLTCTEVLELPAGKKLSLTELQTIQPKDMVQCVAHLGKEPLSADEADYIWKSIILFHNSTENIPDDVLMLLHWVTTAVTPEDYAKLTLSDIDVIQNFGLNYHLNQEQLSAIANRVREDFAEKLPEHYTYYDLTALKQILCAFNRSEIERIHPSAYKEAAVLIGKLEYCNPEVMSGFATLAVHTKAFGRPENWSKATVQNIGQVANYFPNHITEKIRHLKETN